MSASTSASTLTAYLLVSHGSRDPRSGQGLDRLAHFVRSQEAGLWGAHPQTRDRSDDRANSGRCSSRERWATGQVSPLSHRLSPAGRLRPSQVDLSVGEAILYRRQVSPPQAVHGPLVGTACLEAEALPLHQQIIEFSRRAQGAGAQRICIIPLFLLAGVHVMDDIPAEVDQARQALQGLTLEITPHLGSHPGLKGLLHAKLGATASEALILLAHGSHRPRGTDTISTLARTLGGTAAFWAVAPSLESQVIHHMQVGVQRLAILPYFLFAGKITDAVTHLTEELAERFPSVSFHLLPPRGPSLELARLVIDLALDRLPPKAQQSPVPMQRVAFRHAIHSSSMVS